MHGSSHFTTCVLQLCSLSRFVSRLISGWDLDTWRRVHVPAFGLDGRELHMQYIAVQLLEVELLCCCLQHFVGQSVNICCWTCRRCLTYILKLAQLIWTSALEISCSCKMHKASTRSGCWTLDYLRSVHVSHTYIFAVQHLSCWLRHPSEIVVTCSEQVCISLHQYFSTSQCPVAIRLPNLFTFQ